MKECSGKLKNMEKNRQKPKIPLKDGLNTMKIKKETLRKMNEPKGMCSKVSEAAYLIKINKKKDES